MTTLKLNNLKRLELSRNGITGIDSLKSLAKGDWPKLSHLDLSSNQIADSVVEALSPANWPLLEVLDLSNTAVTKKGLLNLLLNANWPSLKEVKLHWQDHNLTKSLLKENWPSLEELNLSKGSITRHEMELIIKKTDWPLLKSLNMSNNPEFNDAGLEALMSANWPRLETLDVQATGITKIKLINFLLSTNWPSLVQILFDKYPHNFTSSLLQKNWPQLAELDLSRSGIGQYEIDLIVNTCKWPRLKSLSLAFNQVKDEGLETLSHGDWPLLEVLNLESIQMTTLGLEAIVKRAKWSQLKRLILATNKIFDKALDILSQADWPELEIMDLRNIGNSKNHLVPFLLNIQLPGLKQIITGDYISQFTSCLLKNNWPRLVELNLTNGGITEFEIDLLVNKCQLPELKKLDLTDNIGIKDGGFQILAQGNWNLLESLILTRTKLTAAGLEAIVNFGNWPRLNTLSVYFNDFNDKELAILARGNWPELEKLYLNLGRSTRRGSSQFLLTSHWPKLTQLAVSKECNKEHSLLLYAFIKKSLSHVKVLELNNLNITLGQIEKIINEYKCPKLQSLNLSNNEISSEGFFVLACGDCPLLEELNLENTKMTLEGVEALANQSKWPQLKILNVSNNEIQDEGLSALALAQFPSLENLNLNNTKITSNGIESLVNKMKLPNLKRLEISNNAILDEGLRILASGDWPLFEHLTYYDTKVTLQGNVALLENLQWQNLNSLEHSIWGSFFNYDENLNKWVPSEIIQAIIPEQSSHLVVVFDITWLNSLEISLSISQDNYQKKFKLVPRDKLEEFEYVSLSPDIIKKAVPISSIVLPSSVKILDFSNSPYFERQGPSVVSFKGCHLLEDLRLCNMEITTQELGSLLGKLNLSCLKRLDLSDNKLQEKGLEVLATAKCPLLESLNLENTQITASGIQILASRSKWPNLKQLSVSGNLIQNKGFEKLVSANWPLLEQLSLQCVDIKSEGIEVLKGKLKWPNLKKLNLSTSPIQDEGLQVLASANWQLLEDLCLSGANSTNKGIECLTGRSDWMNLRRLDLSWNTVSDEGLELLVSAKWSLLEYLNLKGTSLSAQNIQILASKSHWPDLKKLDVSWNSIQDEGFSILASANWPKLEHLNLRKTELTKKSVEILISKTSNRLSLKKINISRNDIGDRGLEILTSANWPLLELLDLEETQITERGIKTLTSKSNWPNLKKLSVAWNSIKNEGLETLCHGKWPLLEKLSLGNIEITEKGIENMIKLSDWPYLRVLDVSHNQKLFDEGLGALASGKWPLLESLHLNDTNIAVKDVQTIVKKSSWPKLKEIRIFKSDGKDQGVSGEALMKKAIAEKWPRLRLFMGPDWRIISTEYVVEQTERVHMKNALETLTAQFTNQFASEFGKLFGNFGK